MHDFQGVFHSLVQESKELYLTVLYKTQQRRQNALQQDGYKPPWVHEGAFLELEPAVAEVLWVQLNPPLRKK